MRCGVDLNESSRKLENGPHSSVRTLVGTTDAEKVQRTLDPAADWGSQ